MLLELFISPLFLFISLLCLCYLVFIKKSSVNLPRIPIVGARNNDWFPILQAKWRNTIDFKAAMEEAHAKYKDQPVIVPVASAGEIVLLPQSDVEFVANQADDVLGFNERAFELYQIDYTFMDPAVPRFTLHESLLRTALTPQIGNLIPVLADEVAWVFDKYWGNDTTEWHELSVFETMRHIVGGVANRAFVGLPFVVIQTLSTVGWGLLD